MSQSLSKHQFYIFSFCVHQLCGENCKGVKLSDDLKQIKEELKKIANNNMETLNELKRLKVAK